MQLELDDNFDDIDGKPAKKKRSFNTLPLLGSFMPLILIILTIVYIGAFQKEAVNDFLKKYDFIGVSQTGQAEKQRLYLINNLPIPYEQRQALRQGTVFLGATKQMVELALGKPASAPEQTSEGQEKWVYFFQDSSRPTYLYFEKDKLVNAAKGTTLDNAEIQ